MKTSIIHTRRAEAFTSSKIVADMLEVPHRDLLRTIKKIVKRQKNNAHTSALKYPQKFIETTYQNRMGRIYKAYDMNEQAYMKLAMQLSGYEKAEQVQDAIIEAFALMKSALLNHKDPIWQLERKKTKAVRYKETDMIQAFVEYAKEQGSQHPDYYYQNFTKMTNKALAPLLTAPDGKPVKDLSTIEDMDAIRIAERMIAQIIEQGMQAGIYYKEIYAKAKERINAFATSLAPMI